MKRPPESLADRVWYLLHCLPRDNFGRPPSLRELEKSAGLSQATLSKTITGVRTHHEYETFLLMAEVLRVTPNFLWTGQGVRPALTGDLPPKGFIMPRRGKNNLEPTEGWPHGNGNGRRRRR